VGAGLHLYSARPASTAVQSMAKSIWRTKGDILAATVCAALSTTLGCARMILRVKRGCLAGTFWNTTEGVEKVGDSWGGGVETGRAQNGPWRALGGLNLGFLSAPVGVR
jgi:hypothetical protein